MEVSSMRECPVPKGVLLIIGGHENKGEDPKSQSQKEHPNPLEILKVFVEQLDTEDPAIEIVTTAGSLNEETFREYFDAFKQLNVRRINHILHNSRDEVIRDTSALDRLEKADGIFFTGGDQLKLTSLYGGTDFLLMLKKRYIEENIVIAGTSAGAMALSTPMIYAGNEDVQQVTGEIKVTVGLEFLKDACIDTHFIDRHRFVRMAQVIASNPSAIGLGIGEDTAMLVKDGNKAEIKGSGIVVVIDGFEVSHSNILDFGDKVPLSIRNLRVHLLTSGDIYEIPQINPPHL